MFYTYESGGRVSRPISDYRSEVLSGSFAARGLESFNFNQGPAVPLSDISGTLAYHADSSIYNLVSQRSGLGILNGAQTSQQDVPPGYVLHQPGPIYSWTTDELGGNADDNRIFIPAPSRILFLNNAEETKSYSYHPAVIDLYTEVDFGSITDNAGNNTSNNGLVTDLNATLVDYGRVVYVTTVESFGFSKTLNAASWKATSAWVGSGRLISFGKQTSPAVYGTITDGKVRLSGTADVDYSPAIDGRGILPLQGNSIIGIAAAIEGFGSLRKFSGSSESLTVNPDERQMLFSFTGERIEKTTNIHIGSGRIRNLATLEAERGTFDYIGSGEITIRSDKSDQYKLEDIADWILEDIKGRPLASIKYEPADEKHTEDYNESAVVRFTERDYGLLAICSVEEIVVGDISGQGTGCITKVEIGTTARVVSGQTYQPGLPSNSATNFVDWGSVTEIASMREDGGWILNHTDLIPFGGLKIDPHNGCADKFLPSWTSRGYISKITGVASVPLDVGVRGSGGFRFLGASKTNFALLQPGDGLFRFYSRSAIGISATTSGDGRFSTFSGGAESATFNPTETQMLFSFTGEYKDLRFTFGTYHGDGRLFNVSGGEERGTNSYVGSGEIKLLSRKPKLIEPSDEKHTEDYNFSSFVPSVDLDYGFIVDPSLVSCVNVPMVWDITTNTTATTGCTKVPGTLSISATYSIPLNVTSPTSYTDLGSVSTIASPSNDYGWILGTHAHGIPFGTVADITGNAAAPRVFNEVGDGRLFRLRGVARVPLDQKIFGGGLFKPQGASITNFSLLAIGDGHINGMSGDATFTFHVEHLGDGRFSTFSGGAESATFNPEEKQMLFSFTGGYTDLRFTHGTWHGSGRIKNFATLRAERTSYDYTGSGTILTWNKLEEARTYWYNCSSIVEFQDLDYGFLVDPSTIPVTSLTTQTISDVTAPTGHVRVEQGEVVTLDGTYSVPLQTTTATEFIDHNILLESEDLLLDHGHILDTVAMGQPACIYGEIDITGAAPSATVVNEVGDGRLFRLRGVARVPLDAKVITYGLFKPGGASKTNFSLLAPGSGHINGLSGAATFTFHVEHLGDGRFSTFSGGAESATFNPEEKQMLFSLTGGYTDLKLTHGTWLGSGRIKNFATLEAEKQSFDWVGSGEITIESDKPDQYTLEELAKTQLLEIRNVNLCDLKYEPSDEKHTECYSPDSLVEFLDVDYGFLVDPSTVSVTTLNSQTIASDITAPTGHVRVEQGETVILGGTYSVPIQTTTATEFIDYNLVNETEDGLWDHGHILDTVAMGYPFGEIYVKGTASSIFQPNWVGSGTVRVDNAAHANFSVGHIGSGDLFSFNGSSDTLSVSVEGGGLFSVGGTSPYAVGIGIIGEGSLRKFSGAAESVTFNPEEKQMLFSFIGTSGDPGITLAHEGSGNLFAFDGSGERETNAWYGSGTITLISKKPRLDEPSDEKHTEVYDLGVCHDPEELDYGFLVDPSTVSITPLTTQIITSDVTAPTGNVRVEQGEVVTLGGTYSVPIQTTVPTEFWDNYLVAETEDGLWNYGWILDDTGKDCPFGQIGVIRGDAATREIQVYTFVATGESEHKVHGINIGGDAFIFVPPAWNSPGDPPLDVTGDADPTLTRIAIFDGGSLFGLGGAAECTTIVPPTEDVLFRFVPGPFDRWTTYDWQPSWVSKGGITLPAGFTDTRYVPHVIGSGTFRKFAGAAESISFNPEERQLLFSFTGEHQVSFTANPPEDTARVKVGSLADTRFIPKYPGSGEIYLTGIAKTHWVPHIIGTGFIPTFSGAAESITFNPEEKQMLFSFVGTREAEKVSVTETGFGTLHLTGESTQLLTFAEQPFGTIPVSGEAKTHYVPSVVGSGTLRKISGAAESITFNPEEKQMLFSFTGAGSQTTTVVPPEGFGTLFGFSGASITTRSAYETQGLYQISGDGHITASLLHVGSGTFRKFAGAAESLTVNPDERQLLFSFTGAGSESTSVAEIKQVEVDITGKADPVLRTFAWHGSGTISVTGEAKTHYVPHVIGTGYIPVFNGAAESLTVNPEEKQMLFSFTGTKEERILVREVSQGGTLKLLGTSGDPLLTFAEQPFVQTKISGKVSFTVHRSIFGSGSLYAFSGAAEATAIVPEPSTILFQTYGESELRITRSYVGSGTLRKISGAAESVTFNPDEQQMLFSFTGAGTQSKTAREIGTGTLTTTGEAGVLIRFAHTGEGTISLSGDAHTTRARDFVGFGTIPVLTGAAESISFNPEEKQLLFSFHGKRISEKITARELSQGGTLVVGSTSGDPLLTFAEQPYVRLDITGDSYDIRTRAYQGSGRISNVNNLDEAFARTPYIGSGIATITGDAFVQVQLFQPPHVQVWII